MITSLRRLEKNSMQNYRLAAATVDRPSRKYRRPRLHRNNPCQPRPATSKKPG